MRRNTKEKLIEIKTTIEQNPGIIKSKLGQKTGMALDVLGIYLEALISEGIIRRKGGASNGQYGAAYTITDKGRRLK